MPRSYDAAVIGSGPGGYVAAIRLAQLGKNTLCIEAEKLGGVCLNRGCIPSKALIAAADLYHSIESEGKTFGISIEGKSLDFSKTQKFRERVVKKMSGGIDRLPERTEIDANLNEQLIVEYYSR